MATTTRQQRILETLAAASDELSGQALHRALQESGQGMGLTTVYRHLRQLQQQGRIRCRVLPTGEAFYAPVERDRHHLTCVDCGRSRTLPECPIPDVALPASQHEGFRLLFHTLEFFGLCDACRQRQQQRAD
jgi:Fur family ferric uptake transcriptional regulator